MRAILRAMQAHPLRCAPQTGYCQLLEPETAFIGWLTWPSPAQLTQALADVFAAAPGIQRVRTFAPAEALPPEAAGLCLHTSGTFIYAQKPIVDENQDFHDIRFCDNSKDIDTINYQITVEEGYSVTQQQERAVFSALNGTPFIVALTQKNHIRGALLVHGATTTHCWFRRMFVMPEARGQGASENMLKAALHLAEKRGFQSVSVLVAQKIWDKGWFTELGFTPEKTVRHITVEK